MILEALHRLANHSESLARTEARSVMAEVLSGKCTDAQIAALLIALRMKGETVEEIVGFAEAIRAAAAPLPIAPAEALAVTGTGREALADECENDSLIDTSGTGGDASGTFNISTATALVTAGAGVRVAKHGNRSISSRCGSADVLEALGVKTAVDPEVVARAIHEAGIGFMFAPSFHSATRNVQPVRIELKMRTAFNYLGPLTNPARAEIQVAGTWSDEAAEKIAGAMARLGAVRAYVVHGSDGLGELTVTGPSAVFAVQHGTVSRIEVSPADFGLKEHPGEAIAGGDATQNRDIAESILNGESGAPRDIVLMNAALALVAADKASDFREAVIRAEESIDSGAARAKLNQLRAISNQ